MQDDDDFHEAPAITNLTLSEARRQRRQVEQDVQALENRINLLEKEESKARRRIGQTKQRAMEILRLREENQARKLSLHGNESKEIPTDTHAVHRKYLEKQLARAAREKQFKQLEERRKAKAREFRIHKREHEEAVRKERHQSKERVLNLRSKVRQEKLEARLKLHKQRNDVRLQSQINYFRKIEEEKLRAREYEQTAAELEQREIALIDRLQSTQNLQREAYTRLEDALCAGAPPSHHTRKHGKTSRTPNGRSGTDSMAENGEDLHPHPECDPRETTEAA